MTRNWGKYGACYISIGTVYILHLFRKKSNDLYNLHVLPKSKDNVR